MTRNPFTDGQPFSAAKLNSMHNAHANEGVMGGLELSTGDGDTEVHVSSGEIIINYRRVTVDSGSKEIDTSNDTDRIDLVVATADGDLEVERGEDAEDDTPGKPVAPDIPANTVLIGLVHIPRKKDKILPGDLYPEYKTEISGFVPPPRLTKLSAVSKETADQNIAAMTRIFNDPGWASPRFTSGPTHGEKEDNYGSFSGVVLVPDGRMIFAPALSDHVGIFDPSDDSYTSGPAHGEEWTHAGSAFDGAVLAPDGRVIFVPSSSKNVGIFDPSNDSYTSKEHDENHSSFTEPPGAFSGAALAPDGRVILAPRTSNHVGIFDPSDDSYTRGEEHFAGGGFSGAALAPDGRVVFAPTSSSNVGIFDPSDDSYTSGPTHGEGLRPFSGAALAPDGRVILAPRTSNHVGIFDPSDDSYTSGPTYGEEGGFSGAALAPDGRVIFAPEHSDHVGILNLATTIEKPMKNATHPLVQSS